MTTAELIALVGASAALFSSSAAWGAFYVSRWNTKESINAQVNIGARNSRANVVSANRQNWIDAIRNDVASFISTRARIAELASSGSFQAAGRDALLTEERQLRAELTMLYARVDMRLNHDESDHQELLGALRNHDNAASADTESALRAAGRKIFKDEWERLKKEASGIDPFVKEAVPPHRV